MKIKNPFKKRKMFEDHVRDVIKGLNDLTIQYPHLSDQFNKVTDMLEAKLFEKSRSYKPPTK